MNKIAALNDRLRRTFARGKVVMTAGVAALPEDDLAKVLERVRTMTRATSTILVASRSGDDLLLQGRLLLARYERRFGRPRQPREDDARPHHHARR
jgi:hypothetical protein